jgi:hypothetical protein
VEESRGRSPLLRVWAGVTPSGAEGAFESADAIQRLGFAAGVDKHVNGLSDEENAFFFSATEEPMSSGHG